MYVSTLEFAGNGPKRSNGPSPQGYTGSCNFFFTFIAQIWPLLSIHTLKSAIFAAKVQIGTSDSGPKWRFRTRKAAAIFYFLYTLFVK
jgi:hypothetical protein